MLLAVALPLLLLSAPANPPGQPNPHRLFSANPLAGLPALPKPHHTFGNCRASALGSPWTGCPFTVDADSPLQIDFARITHAWPLEVGWGGGFHLDRDADGNPLWDEEAFLASQNRTEVVEATRLCAKANASLTVTAYPWSYYWGSGVRPSASAAAQRVAKAQCPAPHACDPTVRGPAEALEVQWHRRRLQNISAWVAEANAELGSHVRIGAILIDCEQFYIDQANQTLQQALARKHDLIYTASLEFCPQGECTIEQYNRVQPPPVCPNEPPWW